MKFVFNVFKLALQFFFKIISFTLKPFKYLILFLIIILFFSSSNVFAQVVPTYHLAYIQTDVATAACNTLSTDYDDALIRILKIRPDIKVSDRFYFTTEYIDTHTAEVVSNSSNPETNCSAQILGSKTALLFASIYFIHRDKLTNAKFNFNQSGNTLTRYAWFLPYSPSFTCASNQEKIYGRLSNGAYFSYCKNQQLRYANQSCFMKYNQTVDVYHSKTTVLDNLTELTSYIDDYADPTKTVMCRLSYKLKYKEDKNCIYKHYFYNGLHHDQAKVLMGDITPVDLVDYQNDQCSYILSPSYTPPTPDWNPDDEIPNLGEIGSAFDPNKDYDGDGQIGTDSDLRWCIENEFGCRVCLDGNCEAWPPGGSGGGGSGGGGSGGGGSGGGTDPTDPVDCDLTPDDPACSENPPVNCDLYPTHSSCVEEPPVDCEKNPTDPSCPVKPVDCEKNPTDPSCPTKPVEPPKYGGPCVDTKSYTAPDGSMVIGISCGVESWYKSKYPDGLKSAFETHINKVKSSNSPIYSIAKYFDFKNDGSTTYPVFSFDLSLLGLDNHSIDMSNLYGFNFWNILKIMVLALFGFAAFRIAFGG